MGFAFSGVFPHPSSYLDLCSVVQVQESNGLQVGHLLFLSSVQFVMWREGELSLARREEGGGRREEGGGAFH